MTENQIKETDRLYQQVEERVQSGRIHQAMGLLLRIFTLDPVHREALESASRLMFLLKDTEGSEIVKRLAEDPKDPEALYKVGYHFISMGRPDAGRPFLEACLQIVGPNADVLYELGYCHYQDRQFGRAAEILGKASADLPPERALVADLLTIECLLFADQAERGLSLLRNAEEEFRAWGRSDTVDALEVMFARYKRIDTPKPWDLRTWHFIHHGGLLLAQANKSGSHGYFEQPGFNYLAVGGVLRLLQAVIEGLDLKLDAVLYLGTDSFPLAVTMADLLGRPARAWENRAGSRELLVLPDLGPLERRKMFPVKRDDLDYLFCFQVFPLKEHVLVPDILGLMAHRFQFPWQEQVAIIDHENAQPEARNLPADTRDPEAIAADLVQAAHTLPRDSKADSLITFYRAHREFLPLLNPERFPMRPVFNPATPA